jgi:hypothetical protein
MAVAIAVAVTIIVAVTICGKWSLEYELKCYASMVEKQILMMTIWK